MTLGEGRSKIINVLLGCGLSLILSGSSSANDYGVELPYDAWRPGSLTPLLKRLEAEGLIRRTRSREDERVVLLTLTEQGKALHKKAQGVPQCILAASGINLEQLKALQKDLLALRGNLLESL
ncbi:MarR family winged helix-turn-helix transcriptional regulator [Pseudomonas sp. AK106]